MKRSGNFWRKYSRPWTCAERTVLTEKLIHYFRQIPDYRCGREKRHDLAEMLVCVTLGFLCGRTTIRRSLKWCKTHLEELRKHMKLKYGIALPSTITRMLCGIDEELALYAFMEWVGEIVDSRNTHLAVDGKALCGATEKTKGGTTPMLLNVVETVRGLILAQLPVDSKTNEITVIPELLKLLDISGSIVTIDAVGTQTAIMEQIHEQGGHFALTVKKNQPEAYDEIHTFMDRLEEENIKRKKGEALDSGMREFLEKYEESSRMEKNRDRNEYRTHQICKDASNLTKSQKEWPHVQSIGRIKQVRIPGEKDRQGNDVIPSKEEFLERGSRRVPTPSEEEGAGKDVQCTALISDLILTAEELGSIKRMHWSIENRLHHVLDDTFREDRSPAKKSRNNLSLIRKYAYNILRLAMYETGLTNIMTEMKDCFCDNAALREQYVFQGIASLY